MSKSQSQVRPGGIFGSPGPFSAPGRVGAGWTCLASVESLLRPFSCAAKFMIISFRVPRDAPGQRFRSRSRFDTASVGYVVKGTPMR